MDFLKRWRNRLQTRPRYEDDELEALLHRCRQGVSPCLSSQYNTALQTPARPLAPPPLAPGYYDLLPERAIKKTLVKSTRTVLSKCRLRRKGSSSNLRELYTAPCSSVVRRTDEELHLAKIITCEVFLTMVEMGDAYAMTVLKRSPNAETVMLVMDVYTSGLRN